MEENLEEIILQRIYENCSKKKNYWNCVVRHINVLPFSDQTKKSYMLSYIQKYLGTNQFIASLLSKNIFSCLTFSENREIECYLKMFDKIEGLPFLLPEEILLKIHKAVKNLLSDKKSDLEILCANGNKKACEILSDFSI